MRRLMKRGFTLIEIMIVVAIIALLAAIAIPNVLRSRTSANESAAIGNLRALIQGTENYNAVNQSYPLAATWTANMVPGGGVPSFAPQPFTAMPKVNQQGYNYAYPVGTATTYNYTAVPNVLNTTGTRSFFADQTAVIRHCVGGAGVTVASQTLDLPPNAGCP